MLVKLQGNFIFACWKNSQLRKVALQSVKCLDCQFCSLAYPRKISWTSISLGVLSCKCNLKIQSLSVTVEETATNVTWHTNRACALRYFKFKLHVWLSCVCVKLLNFDSLTVFLWEVVVFFWRFVSFRKSHVTIWGSVFALINKDSTAYKLWLIIHVRTIQLIFKSLLHPVVHV